jgi:hypothetical protein
MNSDTDLILLRQFADELPPPSTRQRVRARQRLHETFTPTPRLARRSRVAILAVTAAVAALLTALPVLRGEHSSSTASASTVLLQAARSAGQQAGGWPDAAYWHSVSVYQQGGGRTARREAWIGRTKEGSLMDAGLDTRVLPLGVGTFGFGSLSLSWDEVYALPRTADGIAEYLKDHDRGNPSQMFYATAEMLQATPAPPDLRAALFEMASRLPGTDYLGQTTDSQGRTGSGLRHGPISYVVDVTTGRILEFRRDGSTKTELGNPCGTRYVVTYLTQEPAEQAPAPTNRTGVSDGGDNPSSNCG